jgi:P pilus assembly chaperone PapD
LWTSYVTSSCLYDNSGGASVASIQVETIEDRESGPIYALDVHRATFISGRVGGATKKLFVVLCAFCLLQSTLLFSRPVSKEEALATAQSIIERENSLPQLRTTAGTFSISTIEPIKIEAHTVAFLVTLKPQGFLLMPSMTELAPARFISFSGDFNFLKVHPLIQQLITECDLTGHVLGYFDTTNDSSASPSALNTILDIKQLQQNESLWASREMKTAVVFDSYVSAVTPLLKSAWNQGLPYNIQTPTLVNSQGQNEHTVTGCSATAQAQIMNYWKYPDKGTGSNTYFWKNGDQTLTGTFDTNYRWDLMQEKYDGSQTQEQNDAVATLMRDVGYSINMDYNLASKGGSGAIPNDNNSLNKFFKYNSDVKYDLRSSYLDLTAWFNVFRSQVDDGWPAMLAIFSDVVGHAVVVDGYRTDSGNQVHLNMGWSGSYDNYYSLDSILTFTDVNSEYAVINIHPPNGGLATLGVTPASCIIPSGSSRTSVSYEVTNPQVRSVQVWVKGPGASQAGAITSTFAGDFKGTFDWIAEGTTYFYLYEIMAQAKRLLATVPVVAIRDIPTIKVTPASPTIPAGSSRTSVSYQVANPGQRLVQVWVKAPSDGQDKAITATFTATSFNGTFDWIAAGTTIFNLYDVSGAVKQLLATATVVTTNPVTPTITVTPSSPTIPAGSSRTSVSYQVANPGQRLVQVWVKAPSDSQDKAITATFTATSFIGIFDWIAEGTTVFNLYDVSGAVKQLLATATVVTTNRATSTITVTPSSPTIPAGSSRTSVSYQVANPGQRLVQVWVKAPSDSQDKAITATFTATSFIGTFDWIAEGTTVFNLYDLSGAGKQLLATATVMATKTAANVQISFLPDPVNRSETDGKWYYRVNLREINGVGFTLTKMLIGGVDYSIWISTWFGSNHLQPYGQLGVNVVSSGGSPPIDLVWEFGGDDDNGHQGLVWKNAVRLLQ